MDHIIRQITEDLISRLPDSPEAYQMQQLRACDFPPFLVRRIYVELEQKLAESMPLPQTDWAHTGSEAVQQAWQHFLNAIEAEAHLPASYARAVIETAVADTLAVLVQPRKNIPSLLFEGNDVWTARELAVQAERLVVYPHFAKVLINYMKRKERTEITREQCEEIITQVDTKLTGQYTPLQWAQLMDPLFILIGKQIDTDLFRLFFEDKKMLRTARKFDLMDAAITRAQLIEVLSSPDLLNYQGYEPDQSELFDEEREMEEVITPKPATIGDRFLEPEEPDDGDEDEPMDEAPFVENSPEDDVSDADELKAPEQEDDDALPEPEGENITEPASDYGEERFKEPEEEKAPSLNDIFVSEEDELEEIPVPDAYVEEKQEDETPLIEDPTKEEPLDLDEAEELEIPEPDQAEETPEAEPLFDVEEEQLIAPEEEAAPSLNDIFVDEEDGDKSEEISEPEADSDEDSDVPIWQRFIGTDESNEEYMMEESVANFGEENDTVKQQNDLEILLQNNKSYFVKELFRGSEQGYEASLQQIAHKKSWKAASKLIRNDIFERNNVNIYSEAAVDFTDRLQTYFSQR